MSETYDFPDSEDIPQIETTTDEPFTRPESKSLFIQYDPDEWETEEDAVRVIETINSLFLTETQITIIPEDFDLLSRDDVEELLADVANGEQIE